MEKIKNATHFYLVSLIMEAEVKNIIYETVGTRNFSCGCTCFFFFNGREFYHYSTRDCILSTEKIKRYHLKQQSDNYENVRA